MMLTKIEENGIMLLFKSKQIEKEIPEELFSFPVKEKKMKAIKIIIGEPIINWEALPVCIFKEID